jgi:hydroxymethylpyrimidine pyrophosphatase-like HAD family hydrolase
MRYVALATDYEGALVQGGRTAARTLEARERERERSSNRRFSLITGRQIENLPAQASEGAH